MENLEVDFLIDFVEGGKAGDIDDGEFVVWVVVGGDEFLVGEDGE